jgi:hypothetical protein
MSAGFLMLTCPVNGDTSCSGETGKTRSVWDAACRYATYRPYDAYLARMHGRGSERYYFRSSTEPASDRRSTADRLTDYWSYFSWPCHPSEKKERFR